MGNETNGRERPERVETAGETVRDLLKGRPALGPDDGAAFFGCKGDGVRGQWKSFCGTLEWAVIEAHDREQATGAAPATYALFHCWFSESQN